MSVLFSPELMELNAEEPAEYIANPDGAMNLYEIRFIILKLIPLTLTFNMFYPIHYRNYEKYIPNRFYLRL